MNPWLQVDKCHDLLTHNLTKGFHAEINDKIWNQNISIFIIVKIFFIMKIFFLFWKYFFFYYENTFFYYENISFYIMKMFFYYENISFFIMKIFFYFENISFYIMKMIFYYENISYFIMKIFFYYENISIFTSTKCLSLKCRWRLVQCEETLIQSWTHQWPTEPESPHVSSQEEQWSPPSH